MKIKEINAKSVEFTGILHLFKETSRQQQTVGKSIGEGIGKSAELLPKDTVADSQEAAISRLQQNTILILSIPDYTTPQDFLLLMGNDRENILHIRILVDSIPKRYGMLIKFKTDANQFFDEFNGRPFSSFEVSVFVT